MIDSDDISQQFQCLISRDKLKKRTHTQAKLMEDDERVFLGDALSVMSLLVWCPVHHDDIIRRRHFVKMMVVVVLSDKLRRL